MDKRVVLVVLCSVILFAVPSTLRAWQQSVAYKIDVALNTKDHTLTGQEILIYRNHSPDTLKEVWFHVYPNAYRDNQTAFARETYREGSYRFFFASRKDRGFMDIQALQMGGVPIPPGRREVKDTEMKVLLPRPIPRGTQRPSTSGSS